MMCTGTIFKKRPEYSCSSVLTIPTVKQTPIKTLFLYDYNYKTTITITVTVSNSSLTSSGLALKVRLPSSSCIYNFLKENPRGGFLLYIEQ